MSHAAQTALSSRDASGADRVRKIFCRIYGILSVVFGVLGTGIAAFAIWVQAAGRAQELLGIPPDSISAYLGPYLAVGSLVTIVLGVLIIRQSVMAALLLLAFTVLADVLGYLVPAFTIRARPGEGGFSVADAITHAIVYGIMLAFTAIIVVADRAARSAEARR